MSLDIIMKKLFLLIRGKMLTKKVNKFDSFNANNSETFMKLFHVYFDKFQIYSFITISIVAE